MELFFLNSVLIILGGCLGSFASMLIYRLPRMTKSLNIFYPRPFCPKCKTKLSIFQLIPFLSYFLNAGKCRSCEKRIRISYLINEFIIACFVLYIMNQIAWNNLTAFFIIASIFIMYVQSVMDLETLLLSKPLSIMLVCLGLSLNISQELFTIPIDALLGLIFGCGILFSINLLHKLIRATDVIDSGDYLLLGGIGATFGASAIGPILLIGSSITLTLYAIKKDRNEEIPLGFGLGLAGILYCLLFISNY